MTVQNKKPAVKSARASKNEFERVMKDIEKENAVLKPTSKAPFYISGFAGAGLPLFLYISKVFDGKVRENVIVYGIVVIVAAIALTHSNASLAAKTRKTLVVLREAEPGLEADLKQSIVTEASSYAIFAVNTLYLIFFLFSIFYILPVYALSEYINFSVASILSSVVVVGLVALKAL